MIRPIESAHGGGTTADEMLSLGRVCNEVDMSNNEASRRHDPLYCCLCSACPFQPPTCHSSLSFSTRASHVAESSVLSAWPISRAHGTASTPVTAKSSAQVLICIVERMVRERLTKPVMLASRSLQGVLWRTRREATPSNMGPTQSFQAG